MAPEVLRGDAVDRRSDVWALGACVYEAAHRRAAARKSTRMLKPVVPESAAARSATPVDAASRVARAARCCRARRDRARSCTAARDGGRVRCAAAAFSADVAARGFAGQMRQLFGDGRRRTMPALERAPEVRVGTEPLGIDAAPARAPAVEVQTELSAEPFRAWKADDEGRSNPPERDASRVVPSPPSKRGWLRAVLAGAVRAAQRVMTRKRRSRGS